jgi:SAM-dependent methyltransferase
MNSSHIGHCQICDYSGSFSVIEIQERMLGTKDVFQYTKCPECQTIAILNPPENLGKYYPGDYYSFNAENKEILKKGSLKNRVKRAVIRQRLGKKSILGTLLGSRFDSYLAWLMPEYFSFKHSILDVGCGYGFFLLSMANAGFSHLKGIDPYNESDLEYENGLEIKKANIFEEEGKYDVIMLHHAFEHMDEPESVLKKIKSCLNPGGTVLIRIPVSDAKVWKEYGPLWVQLDAPRHFFIHSIKGMERLAQKVGFWIDRVEFDSYSFQYWGSELYRNDKLLSVGPQFFSQEKLKNWEKRALENNQNRNGDQACFYLKMA